MVVAVASGGAQARSAPRQTANGLPENKELTADDLSKIVDWLEVPDNFAMLYGSRPRSRPRLTVGKRANFRPPALGQCGLPGEPELILDPSSDDEEQDYDNVGLQQDESEMGVANGAQTQHEDVADTAPEMNDSTRTHAHPEAIEQGPANTRTPGSVEEDSQSRPIPPPAGNGQRRVPTKRAATPALKAQSRSNMANLYLDKIGDKSMYRREMIQTKYKCRTQELVDRRQAREIAAAQQENKDPMQRRNEEKRARLENQHVEKRARLEHQHQLVLMQYQQHTALLAELIRSNRSVDEMKSLLNLIPPALSNVNNTAHQLDLIQRTTLLTALIESNRSMDEMKSLLNLLPSALSNVNNTAPPRRARPPSAMPPYSNQPINIDD